MPANTVNSNTQIATAMQQATTPDQPTSEELPDEIWVKILRYLSAPHINQVAKVNKRFCRISQDDAIWRPLCKQSFPHSLEQCIAKQRIWRSLTEQTITHYIDWHQFYVDRYQNYHKICKPSAQSRSDGLIKIKLEPLFIAIKERNTQYLPSNPQETLHNLEHLYASGLVMPLDSCFIFIQFVLPAYQSLTTSCKGDSVLYWLKRCKQPDTAIPREWLLLPGHPSYNDLQDLPNVQQQFILMPADDAHNPNAVAILKQSAIKTACKTGKRSVVQQLLNDNPELINVTSCDESLLMLAAQHSHPAIVDDLLQLGANPNQQISVQTVYPSICSRPWKGWRSTEGYTALHFAIRGQQTTNAVASIFVLLAHGADPWLKSLQPIPVYVATEQQYRNENRAWVPKLQAHTCTTPAEYLCSSDHHPGSRAAEFALLKFWVTIKQQSDSDLAQRPSAFSRRIGNFFSSFSRETIPVTAQQAAAKALIKTLAAIFLKDTEQHTDLQAHYPALQYGELGQIYNKLCERYPALRLNNDAVQQLSTTTPSPSSSPRCVIS